MRAGLVKVPGLNLPVAALMVAAIASVGCPSAPTPSNCDLKSMPIVGNPLTLLPGARLDSVGDSFVLLGTDGNNVRWARLGTDGQIGPFREVPLPAHTNGPWFGVAGTIGTADHVIVAYAVPSAGSGLMDDLVTISVPFDDPPPNLPLPTVTGQIPNKGSGSVQIAMVSGRAGMNAGVTWAVHGTTNVMARIVDGNGRLVGPDLTIARMIGDFDCLEFSPGRMDMTIGFVDLSGTPPNPAFVGTEIDGTGSAVSSFRVPIGTQLTTGCVQIVPTTTGYGVAWHSQDIGVYFGIYNPMSAQFSSFLVVGDVRVAETPILGGLGLAGKDYTLAFNHTSGGEVWQINAMGQQLGGAQGFPSAQRNTGDLSTQPVGSVLFGTYADYSSPDPANKSAGQRFLERVSCP